MPKNECGKIVIVNTAPTSWDGRKYDVGLYRDSKLILQGSHVQTGNKATFNPNHTLYFSVARNISIGSCMHTGEITCEFSAFDLREYPTGMNIYLTKSPGGGMYKFEACHRLF